MAKFNKLFIFMIPIILLVSCNDIVTYNKDYDDGLTSIGSPEIEKITPYNNFEMNIDEGYLTQMIVIHGNNLAEVTSIRINDVEVDISTIYAVRDRITMPIPRVMPNAVTNFIVVTTKKGSVSFPFSITIPDLVVNGFFNEFTQPGDTALLEGQNFDLYKINEENATFLLNGHDVEVLDITDKSLKVVIPEEIPDNSVFTIQSNQITTPLSIKFRAIDFQILDYDNLAAVNRMSADFSMITDGTASGDPIPLIGKFSRVQGSFAAYAWKNPIVAWFDLTSNEIDIVNNPDDYYIKFEILTKSDHPLAHGNINIGRQTSGALAFSWNPAADGISFNTYGKWKTVTFDARPMFKENAEDCSLVVGANRFYLIYQPTKASTVDFSFCNFRFVKK